MFKTPKCSKCGSIACNGWCAAHKWKKTKTGGA